MTTADPIVDILAGHGWQPRPPTRHAGARAAYPRADGSELLVERRGEGLWLWVVEPGDKRCFELTLGGDLDGVLAGITGMQDELSIENYLGGYMSLSSITETSIIAWEQYE